MALNAANECAVESFLGGNLPFDRIAATADAIWVCDRGHALYLFDRDYYVDLRSTYYVVDEYTDPTGQATHADDARGILAMLGRHSVRWRDLSFAGGDRVHEQGTPNQKSNRDLMGALRRELVRMDQLDPGAEISPQVRTIKRGTGRGHGSVGVRSKWLYHRTCEAGGFGVHPRCKRVIGALSRYDLRDNEWKDPIDAVVYGLDPWIYGSGPIRGEPVDVRLG